MHCSEVVIQLYLTERFTDLRCRYRFKFSSDPFSVLTILRLDVGDGNGAAAGRNRGQDLAALLDVNDRGARRGDGGARDSASGGAGECDGTKVGEGYEGARATTARLEVLDDPLGVVLAETCGGGEGGGDGLALGVVHDRERALGGARGGGGQGDGVTSGEGDAAEVIGVVGVVLVPS